MIACLSRLVHSGLCYTPDIGPECQFQSVSNAVSGVGWHCCIQTCSWHCCHCCGHTYSWHCCGHTSSWPGGRCLHRSWCTLWAGNALCKPFWILTAVLTLLSFYIRQELWLYSVLNLQCAWMYRNTTDCELNAIYSMHAATVQHIYNVYSLSVHCTCKINIMHWLYAVHVLGGK